MRKPPFALVPVGASGSGSDGYSSGGLCRPIASAASDPPRSDGGCPNDRLRTPCRELLIPGIDTPGATSVRSCTNHWGWKCKHDLAQDQVSFTSVERRTTASAPSTSSP